MAIYDMIEVVQGSLGSGKSMVATTEAIYQLKRGGVVATNFDFDPLWAWFVASTDLRCRLGVRNVYDYACDLYSRAFKIGSPSSMIELSGKEGRGLADLCTGKLRKQMTKFGSRGHREEGKGLLILDDCHHFFNSRTFNANREYVTFFANARKWGWRTLLITHSIENIDKQIRSYVELESRFRNLKKMRIPYTPLSLSPVNCFVIVRRYAGLGPGSGMVHSKDVFLMDKVAASMYNTLEIFRPDSVLGEYQPQGLHPSAYAFKAPKDRKRMPPPPAPIAAAGAEPYPQYYQVTRPRGGVSRALNVSTA